MSLFGNYFNRYHNKASIIRVDYFPHIKKDIHNILDIYQKKYPDMIIFWDGNMWDKAKAFLEKTQAIQDVKLHTTKKIVLWSDITQECETDTDFLAKLAHSISLYHQQSPVLAVRSSGQGDATGVGIYESEFAINNPVDVQKAIEIVLASNHTPRASEYRKIRGIQNDEMWIMIEPCIGNVYYEKYIWPELSGRWKPMEDGAVDIGIALWISGGVKDSDYYRISSENFQGQSLGEHVRESNKYRRSKYASENKESSMYHQYFMDTHQFIPQSYIDIPLYSITDQKKSRTQVSGEIKKKIYAYPLWDVIGWMRKLKRELGGPQYIEWAAVLGATWSLTTYITQIANTLQDAIEIDLKQKGICIWETKQILRSWMKDIDTIIVMDVGRLDTHGPEYIKQLSAYNQTHNNYLLIITDGLTYGGKYDLPFESFSNAAAIIEIASALSHDSSPASHYEWLLSSTNILFGVADKGLQQKIERDFASKSIGGRLNILEFTENTFRLVQDAKTWVGKLFLKE